MNTMDEILAAREAAKSQEKVEVVEPTPEQTPIVETPIVETEVVVETKEEGDETPDTFFEAVKTIKSTTTPIVETQKVEVPDDFKKQLEEYKAKLSQYEQNPLHEAIALGASDKDIKQIAKEIAATDVSDLSTEQLIEKAVKDAFPNLSPQELAEALDTEITNYERLSPLAKKSHDESLRTKYSSAEYSSPTLKKLQEAFSKSQNDKVNFNPDQEIAKAIEIETTLIKTIGSQLVGKTLKGVLFDEAKLNEVLSEYDVNKVQSYLDEKGNLDAIGFIQDKFEKKYREEMINHEVERRVAQKMKEYVVTGKATPTATPSVSKLTADEQRLKERGFNDDQIKIMKREIPTLKY